MFSSPFYLHCGVFKPRSEESFMLISGPDIRIISLNVAVPRGPFVCLIIFIDIKFRLRLIIYAS